MLWCRSRKGAASFYNMINIKDGKLIGSNYSFTLPKGYNRVDWLDCFSDDDLVLASDDNKYLRVVVYFEKESQNDMQAMFDKNSSLIKMSDFLSIKRGKGVGVGVYYENTFGGTQHYGERYDFKKNKDGETQIFIDISLWSGRSKDRQTIQEAVKLPIIQAFLESIEYF